MSTHESAFTTLLRDVPAPTPVTPRRVATTRACPMARWVGALHDVELAAGAWSVRESLVGGGQ